MNTEYWNQFYSNKFPLDIPSQFCAMFCQEAKQNSKVIELGCGNGRDSRIMANCGFQVLGIDASESAIAYCIERIQNSHNENIQYLHSDVRKLNTQAIQTFINGDPIYFYSRFFQHSITDEEQNQMLKTISTFTSQKITAYFEFRNEKDQHTPKIHGEHYRRYQTTEHFSQMLREHGFDISYSIEGKGYAKYFDEDPYVSRVIAHTKKKVT